MSGERYEIKNVWDFAKVPDERLDFCLQEFAVAVRMSRASIELLDALAEGKGAPKGLFALTDTFTWIDDDEKTATMTIQVGDEVTEYSCNTTEPPLSGIPKAGAAEPESKESGVSENRE